MNEDYLFQLLMMDSAFKAQEIGESSYMDLKALLIDSDGEDCDRLEVINNAFIQALADHKKQKINDRLVIGAEKIEATTDPKEKARLMVHYNNLLKELSA